MKKAHAEHLKAEAEAKAAAKQQAADEPIPAYYVRDGKVTGGHTKEGEAVNNGGAVTTWNLMSGKEKAKAKAIQKKAFQMNYGREQRELEGGEDAQDNRRSRAVGEGLLCCYCFNQEMFLKSMRFQNLNCYAGYNLNTYPRTSNERRDNI